MEITPEIQALLDAQKAELTTTFEQSVQGLKQNNTNLLDEKKEAQRVKDEAVKAAIAAALEEAKAKGDVASISSSYDEKVLGLQAKIDAMEQSTVNSAKESASTKFAANFFEGSEFQLDAIQREYKQRIDYRDGKMVVLDPNGNLTALTIDDLNKEFCSSSRYEACIKGTQATGGGATGNKGGGAAISLKNMTATEEAIFANQNPELYKQLLK